MGVVLPRPAQRSGRGMGPTGSDRRLGAPGPGARPLGAQGAQAVYLLPPPPRGAIPAGAGHAGQELPSLCLGARLEQLARRPAPRRPALERGAGLRSRLLPGGGSARRRLAQLHFPARHRPYGRHEPGGRYRSLGAGGARLQRAPGNPDRHGGGRGRHAHRVPALHHRLALQAQRRILGRRGAGGGRGAVPLHDARTTAGRHAGATDRGAGRGLSQPPHVRLLPRRRGQPERHSGTIQHPRRRAAKLCRLVRYPLSGRGGRVGLHVRLGGAGRVGAVPAGPMR